jgi:hypothetical protein
MAEWLDRGTCWRARQGLSSCRVVEAILIQIPRPATPVTAEESFEVCRTTLKQMGRVYAKDNWVRMDLNDLRYQAGRDRITLIQVGSRWCLVRGVDGYGVVYVMDPTMPGGDTKLRKQDLEAWDGWGSPVWR